MTAKTVEFTLFDNDKNRIKEQALSKFEVASDDEANIGLYLLGIELDKEMEFGKTYRITIEEV